MFDRLAVLTCTAAIALTAAACGSATVAPAPAVRAAEPPDAVRAAALLRVDLPSGYGDDTMPDGDVVEGQVTLSSCGYDYTSEALRTDRHQVRFQLDDDRSVANEVVAYRDGGAELAMKELRAAIASCPKGLFATNLADMPRTREKITPLAALRTGVDDVLAFRDVITAPGHPRLEATIVVQRSGEMLSGLYLVGTDDLLARLAPTLATRMLEHPMTAGTST